MLTIKKGTLHITEQTIRELVVAIDKAKAETEFTTDPMPGDDMDQDTYYRMKRERGQILVTSDFAPLDFFVSLEIKPCSQESVGYQLMPEVSQPDISSDANSDPHVNMPPVNKRIIKGRSVD